MERYRLKRSKSLINLFYSDTTRIFVNKLTLLFHPEILLNQVCACLEELSVISGLLKTYKVAYQISIRSDVCFDISCQKLRLLGGVDNGFYGKYLNKFDSRLIEHTEWAKVSRDINSCFYWKFRERERPHTWSQLQTFILIRRFLKQIVQY